MTESTELTISGNGTCVLSYNDGFFCGTLGTISRERIMDYITSGIIGDDTDRVRFVRSRWLKLVDDFEAGTLKDGTYPLYFERNPKLEKAITKFRGELGKLGYCLTDGFIEHIAKSGEEG